jgi:uncharacterized membrane protein
MGNIVKTPTYFVDIDGTVIKYRKFEELGNTTPEPIQDVIDYLNEQFNNGAVIIITTARPEDYRLITKYELNLIGLLYNDIIMGCGRGSRIILNDLDPDNLELSRAIGINLKRDEGLKNITIPKTLTPISQFKVSNKRHLAKTISYRIISTLIGFLIMWGMTGKIEIGTAFGIIELLYKPIQYYLHERIWYRFIKFGLIDTTPINEIKPKTEKSD